MIQEIIVTIVFLGHACFLIQTDDVSIMIDPYNERVGYPMEQQKADIVLITHEHADHNNVGLAIGAPLVLRGLKEGGKNWEKIDFKKDSLHIYSVPAYHDNEQGKKRGLNTIFVIEIGKMRMCHSGDLGTTLSETQLKAIGKIDLLMIPTGGFFTIEKEDQLKVLEQLKPGMVFPMHYKTNVNAKWPISDITSFKSALKDAHILQLKTNTIKVSNVQGSLVDKEKIEFEQKANTPPHVIILDPLVR